MSAKTRYYVEVGGLGVVANFATKKAALRVYDDNLTMVKSGFDLGTYPVKLLKDDKVIRMAGGPPPVMPYARSWTQDNPELCQSIVLSLFQRLWVSSETGRLLEDDEPFISGADYIDWAEAVFEDAGITNYIKEKQYEH